MGDGRWEMVSMNFLLVCCMSEAMARFPCCIWIVFFFFLLNNTSFSFKNKNLSVCI